MNALQTSLCKGNILVVDDSPDCLRSLSALLSAAGYRVRKAISGEIALATIAVSPPDLVLLDINMPRITGYEICERLKANPATREIPVIFLSASNGAIDKIKAFQVGGVDYITKPFEIEEVLARIENQLSLWRMRLELEQAKADALRSLAQERELNRLKSEVVSMIYHDFRTPLASIQGFAGLLRHGGKALTVDQQDRYFKKIDAAIEYLLSLLDKILLINSHEAGKIQCHPAPINLEVFCSELVETFRLNVSDRYQIHFDYLGNSQLVAIDETLLRQILTNLLSNAIKYSPQGGKIIFTVKRQEQSVVFRIQDEGIGIPAENLPHLFETFYRCSNVGDIRGTGLGLAVVQICVNAHQGQIQLESQLGHGTTAIVTLPLVNSVTALPS